LNTKDKLQSLIVYPYVRLNRIYFHILLSSLSYNVSGLAKVYIVSSLDTLSKLQNPFVLTILKLVLERVDPILPVSAKAIKCVFLGYSRLQKGYHCYPPETKKYYMFTGVTFFEPTPFFPPSTWDSNYL